MAVGRLDVRAHPAQRLGDPLHRPARERLVADELEAALLAGEDAREQAHERAGVAAVDRLVGRPQPAQADAVDADVSTSSSSTSTPSARTAAIADSVSPERPKPRITRLAVRDRAEQHRAVGDRLVARDGDVARERDATGSTFISSDRRDDDAVALASSSAAARSASPSPATSIVERRRRARARSAAARSPRC